MKRTIGNKLDRELFSILSREDIALAYEVLLTSEGLGVIEAPEIIEPESDTYTGSKG